MRQGRIVHTEASRLHRRGQAQPTDWKTACRQAFTLPEVLATLVLIGIVIPVAMRGISLSLAAASHARCMAEAAGLAEAKLNELVSYGEVGMIGSGDFGPQWPRYRWTSQAYARDLGITELAVQVSWFERGQEQLLTLATLVYGSNGSSLSAAP